MMEIKLDHGSGGLLSYKLIQNIIVPALGERYKGELEDSSIFNLSSTQIAITTDSFVLTPIFLKNTDIGKLSVCGTINDLVASGAEPKFITLSLILEEGFLLTDLKKILFSIKSVCEEADVYILTGDTKVVEKGAVDKIIINTTGVGVICSSLSTKNIQTNDAIIITGNLGDHSIHVLSMREGLGFETKVLSDCAPLSVPFIPILNKFKSKIHAVRDITRGGLASILNEIAIGSKKTFEIKIENIPLKLETKMACEMLAINPLYLANEGCFCIFCDKTVAREIVSDLKNQEYCKNAAIIGTVKEFNKNFVLVKKEDGTVEVLEFLKGRVLPRLC